MTTTWTLIRTLFQHLPNTHAMGILLCLTCSYCFIDYYLYDLSPVKTMVSVQRDIDLSNQQKEVINQQHITIEKLDKMNWQLEAIITALKKNGVIKEG